MYCQHCYVRYVLRTVSTAAVAVVLPFYAATLWVIASPYTVLPEFLQTKQYHSCRQLSRFLWDPHPTPHTPLLIAVSRLTILHLQLIAATTDGPPEAFVARPRIPSRQRPPIRRRISCRQAYERKECDYGCWGLRPLEEVTSRGVVCYFVSHACNQNVQGDANSCPFTANTFGPERESAKKQTKLICVVRILPVNGAISIGKKLEGN